MHLLRITKWLSGKIIEVIGPLIYFVQIKDNLFWKHHVDQSRSRSSPSDNISLTPESNNSVTFPVKQFDENSNTEEAAITTEPTTDVSPSSSTTPLIPRYPHRDKQKPPNRLMHNHNQVFC